MKSLLLAVLSIILIGNSSVQSAQGLNYKYYEGTYSALPDFNALTPISSGTISSPNLDPRKRDRQFAILYQGYITIPATGNYTFELLSDDGSKLYIGDYSFSATPLVNNDGLHTMQGKTGTVALNAGVYPIAISYFNGEGSMIWQVSWSSNTGISSQKIPDNVLSTTNGASSSGTAGLNYKYYEGVFSLLPDFGLLTPAKTGTVSNFSITPRNKDKQYAFVWSGYITIPVDANYTFETISDDGSKLYIGNFAFNIISLLNNDGVHAGQSRTGSVHLNAGVYPITVTYFQNEGAQSADVYWSSDAGIARQKIPDNVLSTTSSSSMPAPAGETSGISYNYYEGVWNNLPDFRSLTPVKSGTSANIDLSPRNRDKQYAFVWSGNINVPATGTYTFETISDDGSKVYFNSSSVATVNNDGLHASQSKTGSIALNAGLNPITITYFQNDGGQTMELYWSSNAGLSRQKVPDNAFSPGGAISAPVVEAPVPESSAPAVQPVVNPGNTTGSGGLTGNNNYYFSSSNGDDNRSAAQARNPSTPWKTIAKLNSMMPTLQSGDAVLFNRGDEFDGGINITTSGITVSSYGNGYKPVINGFTNITNWTSIGNGIWQAACPSSDKVNIVIMNGVTQQLGRYPNLTDANRGFLTLESHYRNSQITDYQLSGSPNWTGAEVVIRKNHWVLDRGLITNHSGNNINYNSPTAHEAIDYYGYFIQNSPQTLDQLGEWYFDPSQKVLKMFFGSNNPNTYDIKASTVNSLATISNRSGITIDNLFFQGGDDFGIKMESSSNLRVQNCNITLSGTQAASAQSVNALTFEGNSITNTNNDAIDCNNVSNTVIRGNSLKSTGLIPGMGLSGNQQYNGILVEGTGNTIELNTVENTGYSAITFAGESLLVKNNYVNTFCLTVDDGGGIYGWGDLTKYNRRIIGNIVLNGIGAFNGTIDTGPTGATGIFHDDESANVDMIDNSVANCSRSGILMHNSHEMTVRGNTVYNNRTQISMIHDAISVNHPVRNISMDNNVLFSKQPYQFLIEMSSTTNDLSSFGTFNNNYYDRPIDDNGSLYTNYKDASGQSRENFYDLNGWKNAFRSYDQQSQASPLKIPSFVVSSTNGGNRYSGGTFNSNTNGVYCISDPGKCTVSWNSGGKLDGGALQVAFDASSGALNNVGSYIDIGSVQAGRNYLIKFSLIGNYAGKTIKAFMLDGNTYARLSDTRYFALGTSRTENEFLFIAPASANIAVLAFEITGPDCPYWLDNFQVYDVNTNVTNPDDYLRFEYNASTSAKTVQFSGTYVDAKNNSYNGSITLQPFTSAVLIKATGNPAAGATATERLTTIASAQALPEDAEASKLLTVGVYPNPASKNLQITLNAPQGNQKTSLSITSLSGATMKTIPVSNSTTQRLNVDISSWSSGVYIIRCIIDGHSVYKKFVKQ